MIFDYDIMEKLSMNNLQFAHEARFIDFLGIDSLNLLVTYNDLKDKVNSARKVPIPKNMNLQRIQNNNYFPR